MPCRHRTDRGNTGNGRASNSKGVCLQAWLRLSDWGGRLPPLPCWQLLKGIVARRLRPLPFRLYQCPGDHQLEGVCSSSPGLPCWPAGTTGCSVQGGMRLPAWTWRCVRLGLREEGLCGIVGLHMCPPPCCSKATEQARSHCLLCGCCLCALDVQAEPPLPMHAAYALWARGQLGAMYNPVSTVISDTQAQWELHPPRSATPAMPAHQEQLCPSTGHPHPRSVSACQVCACSVLQTS